MIAEWNFSNIIGRVCLDQSKTILTKRFFSLWGGVMLLISCLCVCVFSYTQTLSDKNYIYLSQNFTFL
jgi:hypothetical protein